MSAEIVSVEKLFEGWGLYLRATIRLRDGRTIRREIAYHGDAVAVLAYDPVRRTALLVRQFRAPVFFRTKAVDLLEVIAGMADEDDPEVTARREALEEAGVRLGALERVGEGWTSPGVSTERLTLYLAAYTQDAREGGGGGVAQEGEAIDVAEHGLSDLAAMADAGRLNDLKTFALVQTLRLRRSDLFAP